MTVLRSREIVPRMELRTPAKNNDSVGVIDPCTPAKDIEVLNLQTTSSPLTMGPKDSALGGAEGLGSGNALRRSRRLAAKSDSGLTEGGVGVEENVRSSNNSRKRKITETEANLGTSAADNVGVDGKGKLERRCDKLADEASGNRKRKAGAKADLSGSVSVVQDQGQKGNNILYLRSGKKFVKSGMNPSNIGVSQRVERIGGDSVSSANECRGITGGCGENVVAMKESKANAEVTENDNANMEKKLSGKDEAKAKDKGILVEKDSFTSGIDMENLRSVGNTTGSVVCADDRNPKGKEKMAEIGNSITSSSIDAENCKSLNDVGEGYENRGDSSFSGVTSTQNAGQMSPSVNPRERFRDIARRNASRFAHFSAEEDVNNNHNSDVPRREISPSNVNGEEEDWPGPFSTAMKIIKDRQNLSLHQQNARVDKSVVAPVLWTPRKDRKGSFSKRSVPSLQDICVSILVKHADAITSLNCVPDVLRYQISHLLSDSRRMNCHFLGLLVQGSPTEIRVRDCSWLSEEIFTQALQGCEMSNLKVLQLDQCGRCLGDYNLSKTLACSQSSLPALTTVSLRAAYRLSDVGLSALVSSAPSLRSVDLGQCSLLTSDGICCMAASLGSALRELYLDNCEGIDAMLILPALLHLPNLEVLTLSGSETVSDVFLSEFLIERGHKIKELGLADCTRLTDASVRVVAETCPGLCALDLSNLRNLTDAAIAYLTNGCRRIQALKIRRNSFSDEAVAAYLELCGESLRELSLSNVEQVAQSTAISLAKHSKNLNYLDVSWCRNLTDGALGLIVDNCALKLLKVFGCTQISDVLVSGHSNEEVEIIGLKMKPILEHFKEPDLLSPGIRY